MTFDFLNTLFPGLLIEKDFVLFRKENLILAMNLITAMNTTKIEMSDVADLQKFSWNKLK